MKVLVVIVIVIHYCLASNDSLSRPIKLVDLSNHIADMDKDDGWKKEFERLPSPQTQLLPWDYALKPENLKKHRYPPPEDNLLTYDETRVILSKTKGDQYSDFINANWVDSATEYRRYIGTQCPTPETIVDFYRMVWQYTVHEVVMLANPHDIEKNKCAKYFPDDIATYGDIEVKFQRKIVLPDILVRIYVLKKGSANRIFVHHHFLSWPDMGVPSDPKLLLRLILQYRSSDTYTKAWPVLVHCSAGVGRTGTFLLTDAMFDLALTNGTLDFLKHLAMIRNQRVSLVEKPEQYALAHKVVLQAYKDGRFGQNQSQKVVSVTMSENGPVILLDPSDAREIVIRFAATNATKA